MGATIDRAGNLYVADSANNIIRKITPKGDVTTLSGSAGVSGSTDGAGNAALFNHPTGVAMDASGNIYVADQGNNTIRLITTSGVVYTLAGSASAHGSFDGTGSAAQFNLPTGLALDGSGNIYVADQGNNTIRKITPGGVVSTLAGNASSSAGSIDGTGNTARFNHPNAVAVDKNGNVYVADTDNYTIRMITSAGVVSTIAGTAGVQGSFDGTGSAAEFTSPNGIVVDGSGNLYVTDNNTVRVITPTVVAGVTTYPVTTLAGDPAGGFGNVDGTEITARFYNLNGITVDKNGNVYVVDTGNSTLRMITPTASSAQTGALQVTIAPAVVGAQWQVDGGAWQNSAATVSGLSVGIHTVSFKAVNGTIPSSRTVTVLNGITVSATESYADTTAERVSTFTGSAGNSGTSDGALTAALYASPYGIAQDGVGNFFVADSANQTIRKITPAGVVSTFAGTVGKTGNIPAASDINKMGTAAQFNGPAGIAVDVSGNLYVADSNYCLIRKITPAGAVTTLAGDIVKQPLVQVTGQTIIITQYNISGKQGFTDGKGSAALFDHPYGVAVDRNGYVYVADTGNNTIRKITSAGVVTTLAGNALLGAGYADAKGSAAQFNTPMGVAVDASGNVYVADSGNYAIRKVAPDGTVTTFAGTVGVQGSFDGTGAAAEFINPTAITADAKGNLFVTDNSTIRMITPAGVVTTLAGDPAGNLGSADGAGSAARFYNPNGILADASGNLYVADTNNNTLRKIKLGSMGQTGSLTVTLTSAPVGALWQVDGGAWQASGATVTGLSVGIHTVSFKTAGGVLPSSRTVTVTPSGTTSATESYVNPTAQAVTTLAGSAGVSGTSNGTGSAALFNGLAGVALDGRGNAYVADTDNNAIRKVSSAGVVTTFAGSLGISGTADGTGAAARFHTPTGLAADGSGNLYVADSANHTIRKITSAGVVYTLAGSAGTPGSFNGIGSNAQFDNPTGVAVDAIGNVFVADTGNQTIRRITPGGAVTTFATGFTTPTGVAVDNSTGNVYVADSGNHTISMITSAGVVTTLAGTAGLQGSFDGTVTTAEFNTPTDITIDGSGNLYVADTGNSAIRMITSAGVVTTLAGATDGSFGSNDGTGSAARFNNPNAVAADANGNVYVADTNNQTLRKITQGGTGSLQVTLTPASAVTAGAQWQVDGGAWQNSAATVPGLSVGIHTVSFKAVAGTTPANRTVTVTSPGTTSATATYTPATAQTVTTLAGSAGVSGATNANGTSARFSAPNGMTLDAVGNLYVADAANNTIRKITVSGGAVSTLAGGYVSPFSNLVDGMGSAAEFNNPTGVATDANGNIYVADAANNAIRMITPAGVVSTFAGNRWSGSADGKGASASFDHPHSVALDKNGNVYVADTYNNTIRKITPGGVVTTFAGSAAGGAGNTDATGILASFNAPTGVAVDASGNVYVADTYNFTIRKITPAGAVSTFAGTPGVQGSFDGGGTGNPPAEFTNPTGLAVDASGNVYVTDGSTIRMITPAGVVTTLAGDPAGSLGSADGTETTARFNNPNGLVVDANGVVYVADTNNNTIRKITPTQVQQATGMITPVSGSVLTGASTTFTWSGVTGVTQYKLDIGSTPGASDIYTKNEGTNLTDTVTLPIDGRPLYARLGSLTNGVWSYTIYPYTAANTTPASKAEMVLNLATSSTNGATLTAASTTFTWNAGATATQYKLSIGSSLGASDLYSKDEGVALTDTVTLPTDGRPLYVTLWSLIAGQWQFNLYTYTAYDTRALITSPKAGSALTDASTTFTWSSGIGNTQYKLDIGSSPGATDLYSQNEGSGASDTVTLPTDGRPVYVRLGSSPDGVTWTYATSIYTAVNTSATDKAQMISPVNGSTLASTSTTFVWNAGSQSSSYKLQIGSTPGGTDLYNASLALNAGNLTTVTKSVPLPSDGRTLYVRLWSISNTKWVYNDYIYTAYDTRAQMITPVNNTFLSGASATFTWTEGIGNTQYKLWIGSTPGGYDLYAGTGSANLSTTVTVPTDGRTLYVRLWSMINGVWQYANYTYTALNGKAQMTGRVNGSTLGVGPATFTWNTGTGVTQYSLWIGSAAGAYDLFAGVVNGLSKTVANLPADGRNLFVRLSSMINGAWTQYNSYTYTAFTMVKASMTSPATGSTLPSALTTFAWDSGTGVTQYSLWVGSTPGGYDLFGGVVTGLSKTLTLPGDGRNIYVRLYSSPNGTTWTQYNSYTYKAYTTPPPVKAKMLAPATNGSTLPAASTTFTWDSGTGVTQYSLWVGSTPGGYDLFGGVVTGLSKTLTLPTDGRTLYVRLYSMINGAWQYTTYVYTAFTGPDLKAQMTGPVNGSTLPAGPTTFTWSAGTGVTQYSLWIGSNMNSYDLFGGVVSGLSKTIQLPDDGRPIYVQLWSLKNGVWASNKYTYTTYTPLAGPVKAQMTSPATNGSTLPGASVTFSWSKGTGATQYSLWIGSTPGGSDLYIASQGTNQTKTVTTVPTDGRPVYVTLWSLIGGVWKANSYAYTALDGRAVMTSPAAGSTLTGASVPFSWSAGTGATQCTLWIGNAPGTADIYSRNEGLGTTDTVNVLPTDGRPLYVTLGSLINGGWKYNSYLYSAH